MQSAQHAISKRGRAGFTLAEVVLSLSITSVLLGSMVSLVMLASRSIPGTTTKATAATSSASVLDQFAGDVAAATTIVTATDKVLEFTVPDRDLDGKEETICYSWTGASTDWLCRELNHGGKQAMIGPIATFALSYQKSGSTTALASTTSTSAESAIVTWSAGGLAGLLYTGYSMGAGKALAQNFRPVLAASARSWKITHIQFYAQSDLIGTGSLSAQLRTTDALGNPTSTVLGSATVSEGSLGLLVYGMYDVTFANMPDLAPNQEVALVLACTNNCPSGTIGYTTLATNRTTQMATWNGVAWVGSTLNVMPHIVYGTVTSTAAASSQASWLSEVSVQLQVRGSSSPIVRTSVPLINTPGVM